MSASVLEHPVYYLYCFCPVSPGVPDSVPKHRLTRYLEKYLTNLQRRRIMELFTVWGQEVMVECWKQPFKGGIILYSTTRSSKSIVKPRSSLHTCLFRHKW